MSEPYAAFLKLLISRERLSAWLDALVPKASRWHDWRSIGGEWYFSEVQSLATVSGPELIKTIWDCDARLARFKDNRAAIRWVMEAAEIENIKIAAYDPQNSQFIAGTLTYSENLIEFIIFFTIARGAADHLNSGQHGLAVVHNYIWGSGDAGTDKSDDTIAALRLGPNAESGFMARTEIESAAGAFDALAETMLESRNDPQFDPRDQLDRL